MQIKIHSKHMTLTEHQKEYIELKASHLAKWAPRGNDESSEIDIEVEHVEHKDPAETIGMKIRFSTPGHMFRSEGFGKSVEEITDILEEKLRNQISHTK
jgi:ribosome-associated translation inhibitor RaiA